ncbi:hypothetical protein BDZ94DRAFT_500902 [Collybia nuda]|uniref:Uncharacterized protein n=1 Tax=Collybia nuda TaxID=64659 RepID=A0A9P6CCB2_9AGAR|nr:hypothetical protein BDZ94DRAFT_500902 [Collybia nuda]
MLVRPRPHRVELLVFTIYTFPMSRPSVVWLNVLNTFLAVKKTFAGRVWSGMNCVTQPCYPINMKEQNGRSTGQALFWTR